MVDRSSARTWRDVTFIGLCSTARTSGKLTLLEPICARRGLRAHSSTERIYGERVCPHATRRGPASSTPTSLRQ